MPDKKARRFPACFESIIASLSFVGFEKRACGTDTLLVAR